jgi:hypothetical protein
MKTFTNFKRQTSTLFRELVAAYRNHVNLPRIFEHPIRGGQWKKSTNDREGKIKNNSDANSVRSLELVRVPRRLFIPALQ